MYHWQFPDWPIFTFTEALFEKKAQLLHEQSGKSISFDELLEKNLKNESLIDLLVKEALKTSAIEGEMISRIDLMSSIKRKMGYNTSVKAVKDKRSVGIAEAIVSSRESFQQPLSQEMLFDWHKAIMLGNKGINTGQWRSHSEPMQVVSGIMGREKVHYEAPPSSLVPLEMKKFIAWFNSSHPAKQKGISNALIRSSIAHLYFESIHPFEDGNGRIGRIIAEKALSQHLQRPVLLSLSTIIEKDKKSYYEALKKAQKTLQINSWIHYFSDVVLAAQQDFYDTVSFSLKKTRFFDQIKPLADAKQLKALQKMLSQEQEEFNGGMNASKYISITKVSKATASRDLADLVKKNILVSTGGGRSTSYQLNFKEWF